jgi:hypothetical protein
MSTVSGGGYLGSSISTLMRFKTSPITEIAGTVTLSRGTNGERVVEVKPEAPEPPREYRYTRDAVLEVRDGEEVKAGARLIRRRGCGLRSEIDGRIELDDSNQARKKVRVVAESPADSREYTVSKFDQLTVKPGDRVKAGDPLVVTHDSFLKRFEWRVPHHSLLNEMTMRLDEAGRWVNLSDGGHIENLATIELLRRRCRLIVIGDGEADPNLHFNGLATLMRTARIDLGVEIEIYLDDLRLGAIGLDASRASRAHFAIGRIHYPPAAGEPDTCPGYLLYLKSSYTGDEHDVIGEYRRRRPAFPHESTADQFFDEGQFEAYRALGQHIGEEAAEKLGYKGKNRCESFAELERRFETLWQKEEKKRDRAAAPQKL